MRIIDLEQGSPEWLYWRKTVITATDCPAILGSSPWVTAYKCWQKKLGLVGETKSNDAMERGKLLEPIARERFIKKSGYPMKPVVVESTEFDFLGASLDGLSECGKYILEVKTGGRSLDTMAESGVIPTYYMHQIQHQLLVTGAEKCFYYVGHEDEAQDLIIEVFPDSEFIHIFMPIARAFWKCVALNEPPELIERDYKDMSHESSWNELAFEYKKINEEIKRLEIIKEDYRQKILTLSHNENCMGGGIKVMKKSLPGRIAYHEIPEIKDMDLNKYRKNSSICWQITITKQS